MIRHLVGLTADREKGTAKGAGQDGVGRGATDGDRTLREVAVAPNDANRFEIEP